MLSQRGFCCHGHFHDHRDFSALIQRAPTQSQGLGPFFVKWDGPISLVSMHVIKPAWKTFNQICCGSHLPTLSSLAALRKRARGPALLPVGLLCLGSEQTVVGRPSQVSSPSGRRWDEVDPAPHPRRFLWGPRLPGSSFWSTPLLSDTSVSFSGAVTIPKSSRLPWFSYASY